MRNQKMSAYIDIVFDGPPGPVSGRFVEVESPAGKSVHIGQWVEGDRGYWRLRIQRAEIEKALGEEEK